MEGMFDARPTEDAARGSAGTMDSSDYRLMPSPRNGLRLGDRYRILGLLGDGATSDVYLAEDETLASAVVVKWLTASAAKDPQIRERFILGSRAAMAIEHSCVARIYAVEVPEGMPPYLVMEALSGEPLSDYLEREGPIPEQRVLELARDAAAGLLAAHRVGVIHRDIKPANLYLVGPRHAPEGLKLIDFGLAKDKASGVAGPNSGNVVMGTGQYMAPEQVLADPVDARTDIYGLGVVLFRMLTGHLPFDLDAGIDLFSHQLFSAVPPVSWLREDVDPRLERLVQRCMRKHPENRYPSAVELLADIQAILDGPNEDRSAPALVQLARDPDLYKPRNPRGRGVAEHLAVYFGSEPPPPASMEFHAGFLPESTDDDQ